MTVSRSSQPEHGGFDGSTARQDAASPCPVQSSRLVFDTANLEPRHRLDAARAYFDGLFEPRPLGDAYAARSVSWRIGEFVANCAVNGPAANTSPDDHFMREYCAVRYIARGNYLQITDSGIRRLGPGSLNTSADLDGVSTEGYAFYSLEAPRHAIDAGLLANGDLPAPPLGSPSGRIALELMSSVFEGLCDGSSASASTLMEQTTALFELLAYGTDAAAEAARPEYLRARAAAMQRYIDAHIDDPKLGPAQLARAFGLSRAGVFRAFEPLGGVATAIVQRRMVRAYRTLVTAEPKRGLVRLVAEACGYPDPAHFCRVFRRHLDLSPGDVAQIGRSGGGDPAPLDAPAAPDLPRLSQAYR